MKSFPWKHPVIKVEGKYYVIKGGICHLDEKHLLKDLPRYWFKMGGFEQ